MKLPLKNIIITVFALLKLFKNTSKLVNSVIEHFEALSGTP